MKKILIIAALLASATSAIAQTATADQTSNSNSAATNQGQGNGNTSNVVSTVQAPVTSTIGCLVNCASTDQGSKDLAAAAVTAATINAAAARDVADTTVKIRNTPSVSGQALISSNDTCMGSASGSLNAPGIGLSIGKTYTDGNCVMLKNSRELWNMGMKAAALALMCTDSANREALELTGFECPQTTKAKSQKTASATSTDQPEYTDPIIRHRLGLAPLAVVSK